jgi:hypothetical protein
MSKTSIGVSFQESFSLLGVRSLRDNLFKNQGIASVCQATTRNNRFALFRSIRSIRATVTTRDPKTKWPLARTDHGRDASRGHGHSRRRQTIMLIRWRKCYVPTRLNPACCYQSTVRATTFLDVNEYRLVGVRACAYYCSFWSRIYRV